MIYFKQNKFMKTEEKEREGKGIPDQNLSVQSVISDVFDSTGRLWYLHRIKIRRQKTVQKI